MKRLEIQFLSDDNQHQEWWKHDIGVIDGYVRGGNGAPYACVFMTEREKIVFAPVHSFKVLTKD